MRSIYSMRFYHSYDMIEVMDRGGHGKRLLPHYNNLKM